MAPNDAIAEVPAEAPEADFASAKAMLKDIFDIMGIQRVIVVDDQLSTPLDFERIVGAIRARVESGDPGEPPLTIPELGSPPIDFSMPVEVWRTRLKPVWDDLDLEQMDQVGRTLGIVAAAESKESDRHVLDKILGDVKPEYLSLTEWRERQAELLEAAKNGAALFLFDQDMTENAGRTSEGMNIIADLLKNQCQEGPVYFGLFSNTVGANEEYEHHLGFVEEYGLQEMRDRFAVISKRHLDRQPRDLACRLKRVAISPRCSVLKHKLFTAVDGAVDEAKEKIDELQIYDFEHIVFRSSYNEGVWEVDTLLRLFSAFFRHAARAKASQDADVRKAAEDVRRVVSYPYRPGDAPEAKVRDVARLEMYEDEKYLLAHRIPIEVGDIFKKTSGKALYMLLEQPCDLMVRGGDKNKGMRGVEFVTLAEIFYVKQGGKPPEASAKLDYFSTDAGKEAYVKLEKCATVPVCILDLCVCSNDGVAKLTVGDPCPDGMIPAWQARYEILQAKGAELLARYRGLVSPQGQTVAVSRAIETALQGTLTQSVPGVVLGKIDMNAKRIEYSLQRVGKLRQPWSGGILRDYAYHRARDAYDHDWTRTEQN